jgi:hypothetical protein
MLAYLTGAGSPQAVPEALAGSVFLQFLLPDPTHGWSIPEEPL